MTSKIRVGIIGGAGYTAGELIRILVNHPAVSISWINSLSNAGKFLWEIHEGLMGDTDLMFTEDINLGNIDVLFMCTAHGDSVKWIGEHIIPSSLKIIDLSQDFRDESNGYIYGLPEINRGRIMNARRIANPGCFATAIELSLLPAFKAHAVQGEIQVTALTGSTGAGVKPGAKTHFSWRSDNISTYKEFSHQHLIEIKRTLKQTAGGDINDPVINFVPMRGDFTRGIFASVTFETELSDEELNNIYKDFYKDSVFTHVIDVPLDLKQVVNTNKALLHIEKHGNKAHVVSIIDNLLKGASGQATQNMNLMFGLDETTGLRLKASAF